MRTTITRIFSNRFSLWVAFVLAHLWLGLLNLYSPSYPMGDVRNVYSLWVEQGLADNFWVGIDTPWVYPIVAIVPMLIANAFGPGEYASTWLSLIFILDSVALATLTGWGARGKNLIAGWWWVLFLVVLGPISIGRIDSVTVPIAIVAVIVIAVHPIAGSVLLTVATWIKVWPAALIAAVVVAVRDRAQIVASVLTTSVGIVGISLAFGSGATVFGFITQQTQRGVQVESPLATVWLWKAIAGVGDAAVYYDTDILTYQVVGDGIDVASSLMTPVMAIAVLVVTFLGILASRRGVDSKTLTPVLSLALIAALIVFNKVGSPQFISWLSVPVLLAFLSGVQTRRLFRLPSIMIVVIAALTQAVYPFNYGQLIGLEPVMIVVITLRNSLLIALFFWAVATVWKSAPS
jgi:hypothetical protein